MPGTPGTAGTAGTPEQARHLFRYVTADNWSEYRAVMAVFAGTFFAEFTPEDVAARLADVGVTIEADTLADRLETLRRWGNLTVSSAVGNPTSILDYYRRRNRYLVTQAGQEVHGLVEGVLHRVDEVRDVSTGRLRALRDALEALRSADVERTDPEQLADLVRAVFDPYEAFTREITQFFAAINLWQSRYDLSPEEFRFFAEVLVGYVAERLDEIERTSRPIGRLLTAVMEVAAPIVRRAATGLAARVDAAGMASTVAVRRAPGSSIEDWEHLTTWFVSRPGQPSRMDRLGGEALAAIRTLTLNLTRLSRVGVGGSSRRAEFLRLAAMVDRADAADAARLMSAAIGLHASTHWGVPSADADDPVPPTTSWRDAPRATVALSLRERGDTTNRGRTSPMRDRAAAERRIRLERQLAAEGRRRVDVELLSGGLGAERRLSAAALARVQELLGRALHRLGPSGLVQEVVDGPLCLRVERVRGATTRLQSAEGTLCVSNLTLRLTAAAEGPAPEGVSAEGVR